MRSICLIVVVLVCSSCAGKSPSAPDEGLRAKPDLSRVELTSPVEDKTENRDLGRHGRSTFARKQLLKR
jgi:hypothetical protein